VEDVETVVFVEECKVKESVAESVEVVSIVEHVVSRAVQAMSSADPYLPKIPSALGQHVPAEAEGGLSSVLLLLLEFLGRQLLLWLLLRLSCLLGRSV